MLTTVKCPKCGESFEPNEAFKHELEEELSVDVGKIVNFSEGIGGFPIPVYYEKALDAGIGGGGPSVPTGENEIIVNVTITYQIR